MLRKEWPFPDERIYITSTAMCVCVWGVETVRCQLLSSLADSQSSADSNQKNLDRDQNLQGV